MAAAAEMTGNGKTVVLPKIQRIVTRFPNLECGFFSALLTIRRIREGLDIATTSGEVEWQFVSTATLKKPNPNADAQFIQETLRKQGVIFFNAGDARSAGKYDQHGRPENQSLCELCSLDLLRQDYDFLVRRPWLCDIFRLIRQNDIDGSRISRHKHHLRELMVAATQEWRDKPKAALDFLTLAFCGVFEQAKNGVPVSQLFDPDVIKQGVAKHAPDQADEFTKQVDRFIVRLGEFWRQALRDVANAERYGKIAEFRHPDFPLRRPWKAIMLYSTSPKAAQAARYKGYHLIMVRNPNSPSRKSRDKHVQIFSGTMFQWSVKDPDHKHPPVVRWRLDMGQIARQLRILEANFQEPRQRLEKGDWTSSGMIYYETGLACPWYVPEFRTAVFNGTDSSKDIPPSKIRADKIFQEMVAKAPECGLLIQVPKKDKKWRHYEPRQGASRQPVHVA